MNLLPTQQAQSPIKLNKDCEASLFNPGYQFCNNKALNKTLTFLNHLIELEYVDHELNFTNSGIDYMFSKHNEFMNNLAGKNVDFGDRSKLCLQVLTGHHEGSLNTENNCANHKFVANNIYFEVESSKSPYDQVKFTKSEDQEEMG